MTNEEYETKTINIRNETREIAEKIKTFNASKTPPSKLDEWFKRLDALHEEVDELINEVEVEDFLANGPGKTSN